MVGFVSLQSGGVQLTVRAVTNAVFVLVAAAVLSRMLDFLLTSLADRFVRQRFRVMVLIPVLKFLVYGAAALVVLRSFFQFSQAQLIAFSGLLGAAVGLGVKDLFADVVGGLVLVLERPFQVGDKVAVGQHYGEVTDIGLRSTRLLTPTETLAVVPNFTVFNEVVRNTNTSDTEMMVAVEFTVDPGTDLQRAMRIVEEGMVTSPYVHVSDERPYTVEVEDELDHRTVRGKAFVTELRREFEFKTDVTTRVLETFDREGIRSPTGSAAAEA